MRTAILCERQGWEVGVRERSAEMVSGMVSCVCPEPARTRLQVVCSSSCVNEKLSVKLYCP